MAKSYFINHRLWICAHIYLLCPNTIDRAYYSRIQRTSNSSSTTATYILGISSLKSPHEICGEIAVQEYIDLNPTHATSVKRSDLDGRKRKTYFVLDLNDGSQRGYRVM